MVHISEGDFDDAKYLNIPSNIQYNEKNVTVTEFRLASRKFDNSFFDAEICSSVTSINIPASLTTFITGVFAPYENNTLGYSSASYGEHDMFPTQLPNLQYFYIDPGNQNFTDFHNQLLLSKDKSTLICCPPGASDPTSVIFTGIKKFGPYAFNGCKLHNLIIPNSLEEIDVNAFSNFKNQTSFSNASKNPNKKFVAIDEVLYEFGMDVNGEYTHPKTLLCYPDSKHEDKYTDNLQDYGEPVNIGKFAFDDVQSMPIINLSESGKNSFGITIDDYAFLNCKSLALLNVNTFVNRIGSHAFENTGLVSLRMGTYSFDGTKVCTIEPFAFFNSEIQEIRFPTNAEASFMSIQLKDFALAGCSKLRYVILPKYNAAPGAGLTPIGKYAFANCTSLEEVDFTNATPGSGNFGVLPEGLFYGCTNLKSLKFDDDKITEIGDKAFWKCDLQYWPFSKQTNSLKTIGQLAFGGNDKYQNALGDVNLNEFKVLKSIGVGAFYCAGITNNLLSFYTENGKSLISKIERYTFAGNKFKKITFAEGIKEIGESAFIDNAELTDVFLPNSLEKIEWISNRDPLMNESILDENVYGYFACRNLSKIQIYNNETYATTTHGLLYNKKTMELIHCPEDYKVTRVMGYQNLNVKGLVVEDEVPGIKSLAPYCFAYSTLEKIVLPSTLELIGTGAFRASALKSLTIPASVKKIGSYVIAGGGRCPKFDGINKWFDLFVMPVTPPTSIEYISRVVDGKVTLTNSKFGLGGDNINIYVKKTAYEKGNYDEWKGKYNNLTYKIPIPSTVTKKYQYFSVCRDFDINCNGTNLAAYAIYDYNSSNNVKSRTLQRYVPSRVGANHDKYVGAIMALYTQPGQDTYIEDGNWYRIGEHDYVSSNQVTRSETQYLGPNFEYNWLVGCPIPTYVSSTGGTKYALKFNANKNVSRWAQYVSNGIVPMNKAYLDLTGHEYPSSTQAKELGIILDSEDENTATDIGEPIVDVNEADGNQKAVYYNLNGVKVENPTKGIYVRNGKKVVIK